MYRHPQGGGQMMDLNQARPYIDAVFTQAMNQALAIANLHPNMATPIYTILTREGYDLVLDTLNYEFSRIPWTDQDAKNIICAIVEYVVFVEAQRQFNVTIPEFVTSFNWASGVVGAVQQTVQTGQYQQTQHFITRGNVGQVAGRAVAADVYTHPATHQPVAGAGYQSTFQQPARQVPDNAPQLRSSSLAGGAMQRETHLPKPQPEAQRFVATGTDLPYGTNTQPAPPVGKAPIKVRVFDARKQPEGEEDVDQHTLTEAFEQQQIAEIVNEAENNTSPVVANKYVTKYIPLPNGVDDSFIEKVTLLANATDISEVIFTLSELQEKWDIIKLFSWLSTSITQTVLTALLHRYGIDDAPGFPYLTQPENCANWLDERNIREDIEDIALKKISSIFSTIAFIDKTVKLSGKDATVSMLASVSKTDIIVLPWLCKYSFNTKELKIHNMADADILDDVFQQSFNMVDDATLYLDVYDQALNHYRVFRQGKRTFSPNRFIVETVI